MAIAEFEKKKYDFKYFSMVEDRVRKDLAKKITASKGRKQKD